MSDEQGTFIVIEGSDGSGKTTQLELIRTRLEAAGYEVAVFDFPQYKEPSSYFVRQYLKGAYGTADEVGPYTAALFYALDRYENAPKIRKALSEGKIVLADRFVGSNMAHQGTKFRNAEERRGFFIWLDNLEFQMLDIPRPNLSLVLRVPVEISQKMLEVLANDDKSDKVLDIHEKELTHLKRAVMVFDDLCQLFPKDFVRVDCVRNGKLLDIDTIQDIIWQKIQPLLPDPPKKKPEKVAAAPIQSNENTIMQNPYLHKTENGILEVTEAGEQFLKSIVTNTDKSVYAFTDKLPATTIAAAMAQRAHRVDDLRLTIIEEIAGKDNANNIALLNKTTEKYGNKNLKQLAGLYVVVENASNLLTVNLDRERTATYLDLSSPYTLLDVRDAKGNYSYFVPSQLDDETKQQYRFHMDQIFDLYADVIKKLADHFELESDVPLAKRDAVWKAKIRAKACRAATPMLPVATTTTVGIYASVNSLEKLIANLLSDNLTESRIVGKQILDEARKVVPLYFDKEEASQIEQSIVYEAETKNRFKEVADANLPMQHATSSPGNSATLVDVYPRNELDLLPEMLYEFSNSTAAELKSTVSTWPYDKKLETFVAYFGDRKSRNQLPGKALQKAYYSWDVTSDYISFRTMQRRHDIYDVQSQELSPRLGFHTPKVIEDANLEEEYERCFAVSLNLHSILQAKGYTAEAQYVTLLGNKMHWKAVYDAREAFQILETASRSQNPNYKQLVSIMHQKLSETHPIIGENIKFLGV